MGGGVHEAGCWVGMRPQADAQGSQDGGGLLVAGQERVDTAPIKSPSLSFLFSLLSAPPDQSIPLLTCPRYLLSACEGSDLADL